MSPRKMPEQKPGRSKQNYATPRSLIRAIESRFGKLTFDLAAEARNTVVHERYFSRKHDSLKQNWANKLLGPQLWLNPEFGDIEPWAKKCSETIGKKIFLLVPASVGSNWYRHFVHGVASVFFLSPRLSFDGKNPYPKDCLLALYGARVGHYECWRWDSDGR